MAHYLTRLAGPSTAVCDVCNFIVHIYCIVRNVEGPIIGKFDLWNKNLVITAKAYNKCTILIFDDFYFGIHTELCQNSSTNISSYTVFYKLWRHFGLFE